MPKLIAFYSMFFFLNLSTESRQISLFKFFLKTRTKLIIIGDLQANYIHFNTLRLLDCIGIYSKNAYYFLYMHFEVTISAVNLSCYKCMERYLNVILYKTCIISVNFKTQLISTPVFHSSSML